MNNVLVRTASGVIYIALIVGCILGGPMWFISLMAVFAIGGVTEFRHVAGIKCRSGWAAMTAFELDCLAAASIVYMSCLEVLPVWIELCIIGVIMLYALVRFTLALYDKSADAFRGTAISVLSLFYIAVPLLLLSLVYAENRENHMLVLAAFIMIWINDTGAFCVGSLFGTASSSACRPRSHGKDLPAALCSPYFPACCSTVSCRRWSIRNIRGWHSALS